MNCHHCGTPSGSCLVCDFCRRQLTKHEFTRLTIMLHEHVRDQSMDPETGLCPNDGVVIIRNSELLVMPGQTRTIVWIPERVGVFPFYCTDFCSALHQEMQGYIRVSPKGSPVTVSFNTPH